MKNVHSITKMRLGMEVYRASAHMFSATRQLKPTRRNRIATFAALVLCLGVSTICQAQSPPAAPAPATASADAQAAPAQSAPAAPAAAPAAAPTPAAALPTPSITGPLSGIAPLVFDAGPFGKLAANGVISGIGLAQENHVPGDKTGQADLSNGQAWIQKTDGLFQFYVQVGAYNITALGSPFMSTGTTLNNLYGPVPVAYLKLQPTKTTSIEIGELPTLIGAEYTFSFENMNVERGLLWNQENAVSRGIQLNQAIGKYLTASFSLNDGFYSNRYTWLTGSLTATKGPHALSFVAGGNFNEKNYFTAATPIQNDGSIYNVIYTFTKGPWIIQPYFQYTDVPTNPAVGVTKGASTTGGAVLLSHAFKHGFSLAGRWEYISSGSGTVYQGTGDSAGNVPLNLLFGPGSSATSVTVTPTFQYGGFFVRGDVSWVHAINATPGSTFGLNGLNNDQPRFMAEFGFIFGNNLIERKP